MRATATPDNDVTIAKKVGLAPSTIGRWRSGEVDPKPRQVVAFARAYDKSPLGALLAAGYIDTEDIDRDTPLGLPSDLDDVSTMDLVDELRLRVEAINEFAGWIEAIGDGRGSPANLSASVLRHLATASAPSETDAQPFIDILGDNLQVTAQIDGVDVYGLTAPYVDVARSGDDEDLHEVDLEPEAFDLAATYDDTAVDPERGES